MDSTDCALHRVHHPSVGVLHRLTIDDQLFFVCGTGMDNLRVCVTYMRGGGPSPLAKIGAQTWEMAQRVVAGEKIKGL